MKLSDSERELLISEMFTMSLINNTLSRISKEGVMLDEQIERTTE